LDTDFLPSKSGFQADLDKLEQDGKVIAFRHQPSAFVLPPIGPYATLVRYDRESLIISQRRFITISGANASVNARPAVKESIEGWTVVQSR
jgi:hypothetical protein